MKATYTYIAISLLILFGATYYFAFYTAEEENKWGTMKITSSAFENGGTIPMAYTCDGGNTNPPLSIRDVPEGTKSLILIVEDPDVPTQLKADGLFVHWILYAMPPDTTEIPENSLAGAAGLNGAGKNMYTGPCPPPQYEPTTHRYFFRLFALNHTPVFESPPSKVDLLSALDETKVIGTAEMMATYSRANQAAE